MKNIKFFFIYNLILKYFVLILVLIFFTIPISFWLVSLIKQSQEINTNLNSVLNKEKIKNSILKNNPEATINSVFINITPDNKKTIYVGGNNLSDTSKKDKGALLISNNDGKSWLLDEYFSGVTANINKVMTDFYNNVDGESDSIIVTGEYLKSNAETGNGNSTSAGQVAYERVYYSKSNNKINTISKFIWKDLADRDFDNSKTDPYAIKGISDKIIASSIIKYNISGYIQDHIFVVANDKNIDLNNINNIPYTDSNTKINHPGIPKFKLFDIYISNNDITKNPLDPEIQNLTSFLNPPSIYGIVDASTKTVTSTNFKPLSSSFMFMSLSTTITSNYMYRAVPVIYNRCVIIENQHYTASKNNLAFDNPIVIEYGTYGSTPIYLNLSEESKSMFDNFLIKTISINPIVFINNGKNNDNFLIFGGEKDNKSYMINPHLISPGSIPTKQPSNINIQRSNLSTGSYINNIISFPTHNVPKIKNIPTISNYVLPLVVFGKDMDTSNDNIAFPDTKYIFIHNTQNFNHQGLLLANIHITRILDKKTDNTINTSSVYYSQAHSFINISQVTMIDSSNNYFAPEIASLNSEYNYIFSVYNSTKLNSDINISKYKILRNGDYYNFKKISSKKFNLIIHIAIPVIIIIMVFLIVMSFMVKDIFRSKNKKRKNNNISAYKSKNKNIH